MDLKNTITQQTSLLLANRPEYWDDRFRHDYPLAPTHIRKGMEPKRYRKGCRTFGSHVYLPYKRLLPTIPRGNFWIIGAGELDDTRRVISLARSLGFTVHVADFSPVVIAGVRKYFREVLHDPVAAEENVHRQRILRVLKSLLYFPKTRVVHLSRVLDHITPEERLEVADLLVQIREKADDDVFVTVVNHDTDDNLDWLDKWTTVHPFNTGEFWTNLSERAGYEIPLVTQSEPWEVFGEVFRIAMGRVGLLSKNRR